MFLIFASAVVASTFAVGDSPVLPSMNTWELAGKLRMDVKLQDELDVNEQQIAALRQVRADKKWLEVYKRVAKTLNNSRQSPVSRSDVLFAMEQEASPVFEEIFTPSQLKGLKQRSFEKRFQFGYSPYLDGEVLEICGVQNRVDLADLARDLARSDAEEFERTQILAARKLLASLPLDAQRRFASYAGQMLVPGITESDVDGAEVPVRPMSGSYSAFSILLRYESAQQIVKLTQSQRAQLQALAEARSAKIKGLHYGQSGKNITQHFTSESKKSYEQMRLVMSKLQMKLLSQYCATFSFIADPESALQNLQLTEFFGLDEERVNSVVKKLSMVQIEQQRWANARNRKTFNSMLKRVKPSTARSKMEEMFARQWPQLLE
ncbi:MAG: hypothetical protein AB8B50_00885 [Pirellulaceae bacterium]